MPIDYKNLYNSRIFRVESRFVDSGDRRWPYDQMEARTFLSLLYYYKNSNDFLNIYSAYKEDLKKWNLLDLSKSALTRVLLDRISLNRSCNQPLLSCFDWKMIVNFMLNSYISDGILRFVKYSELQYMSSKETLLEGSFHSIQSIVSFDRQLFNKKGLKNLLRFLNIDIISANYIVDKTFNTKDLTLVKNFILNLISFQNTKSSSVLTKVIEDFNVFFTDTSFDKQTFDEISKKLLENQYAELESFDIISVFDSAEGSKSKASDIFVISFMNDLYKDLFKQSEGESESKKILKSFESYLLSYNKNILLLEAPEIEKYILSFTLERESEISSLIEQNEPFYNSILKKMSFARLLFALLLQTLVAARAFGLAGALPGPLPGSSRDSSVATVVQSVYNENIRAPRAPSNVTPSSSAPKVSLVKMAKPFDDYYYQQQGRAIGSSSSEQEMTSKAIKMPNLVKTAKELEKATEVVAEKIEIIEKDIEKKVKKGNRRGLFDVAINGKIVYSDNNEPIFLANYLNSSMPYGQRGGIVNDFKKTLDGVTISRSELGLIESNAVVEKGINIPKSKEVIITKSKEVIIPKPKEVIIPTKKVTKVTKNIILSKQSPINIEQEHITVGPLRRGFQISDELGSSFAMISHHHKAHTEMMTWLLTSEFGYTSDKLDAIAWYADYLKPLYIENLRTFYNANPNEVDLLNMCGTDVEGVVLGASNAFDAEIQFLVNKAIENKFLLPCSHVRLIAGQANAEFDNFGEKTRGAGHSITQSTMLLGDGIEKAIPILELCECVYEHLIPGTDARAETGKLRQALIDNVSRAIAFVREVSRNVNANIDPALLDNFENIMANRVGGKDLTLEQGEQIARDLSLDNVKEGVKRIWLNDAFKFVKEKSKR